MTLDLDVRLFAEQWKRGALVHNDAVRQHFLDLCVVFSEPSPSDAKLPPIDAKLPSISTVHEGDLYMFKKGGWVDVWKRGYFGWAYKSEHESFLAAYQRLLQHCGDLANPPILVVCDLQTFEVHTKFPGTPEQFITFGLDDLKLNTPVVVGSIRMTPHAILHAVFKRPKDLHSRRRMIIKRHEKRGVTKDDAVASWTPPVRRGYLRWFQPAVKGGVVIGALMSLAKKGSTRVYDGPDGDWSPDDVAWLDVPQCDSIIKVSGEPPTLTVTVAEKWEDAFEEWLRKELACYHSGVVLPDTKIPSGVLRKLTAGDTSTMHQLLPVPSAAPGSTSVARTTTRPGLPLGVLRPGAYWLHQHNVPNAFKAAIFVAPVNGPDALINTILAAYHAGERGDALAAHVVAFFDSHPADLKALIVRVRIGASALLARKGWQPLGAERLPALLAEVQWTHWAGLDTIAAYPLLPLVEALIRPAVARAMGLPTEDRKAWNLKFTELDALVWERVLHQGPGATIFPAKYVTEYLQTVVYASYLSKEASAPDLLTGPRRHILLHGLAIGANRADTLRLLLLLDLLITVLRGL